MTKQFSKDNYITKLKKYFNLRAIQERHNKFSISFTPRRLHPTAYDFLNLLVQVHIDTYVSQEGFSLEEAWGDLLEMTIKTSKMNDQNFTEQTHVSAQQRAINMKRHNTASHTHKLHNIIAHITWW